MNAYQDELRRVGRLMTEARRACVLTGAGVSAESGIPTFRGAGGFWKDEQEVRDLATLEGFLRDPKRVWEWYDMRRSQAKLVQPNPGHYALAEWEQQITTRGGEFALITQNIDGLHRAAGSQNVVELHGNIHLARCVNECSEELIPLPEPPLPEHPPKCPKCGGMLRPHVVWFGEPLNPRIIEQATQAAYSAELMLVVGTSAQVYPAAGLPYAARSHGAVIVEINLEPTELTSAAQFAFHGKSGEILPQLLELAKEEGG